MFKNTIKIVAALALTAIATTTTALAAPPPDGSSIIVADYGSTKLNATYQFRHTGMHWEDLLLVEVNEAAPGATYQIAINGKRVGSITVGASGRGNFVRRDSGRIEGGADEMKDAMRFYEGDTIAIDGAKDRFDQVKS